MIRAAIADDHPLYVAGITAFLAEQPDIQVCLQATNGQAMLTQLEETPVDVLLVDLSMPFDPSQPETEPFGGIRLADRALLRFPSLQVIVLSMHVNEDLILRMLDCGASGYLPKNSDPEVLLQAIRTVYGGGFHFNELLSPALIRSRLRMLTARAGSPAAGRVHPLTEREWDVMQRIVTGQSSREIATSLNISEGTVAAHRNGILSKLGLRNQSELVSYAFRMGWAR